MKDTELIKAIIKSYIIEKKFIFNKRDIMKLLKESINVKIDNIKEEKISDVKILYIYFGGIKRKKCLTFSIIDTQLRIEQII